MYIYIIYSIFRLVTGHVLGFSSAYSSQLIPWGPHRPCSPYAASTTSQRSETCAEVLSKKLGDSENIEHLTSFNII